VWHHKKNIFLEFWNFITTARKYSWKYELWWKCDVNWAKDSRDMTRWIYKYCHTFSLICVPVRTESKITENVWRFLFVQLLISQQIFARFLSNFHHKLYFWKCFLNIMTKFKKSLKNVLWRHHFGTLLYGQVTPRSKLCKTNKFPIQSCQLQ